MVASMLKAYLAAIITGDAEQKAETIPKLSSAVSFLFERYLAETDWSGWLDGASYFSIGETPHSTIRLAGLLASSDVKAEQHWLSPFQCECVVSPNGNDLLAYSLYFLSKRNDRKTIIYNRSREVVASQIDVPKADESIDEREWVYQFKKASH